MAEIRPPDGHYTVPYATSREECARDAASLPAETVLTAAPYGKWVEAAAVGTCPNGLRRATTDPGPGLEPLPVQLPLTTKDDDMQQPLKERQRGNT